MLNKISFVKTIKSFEEPEKALNFLKNHIESGNEIPDFIFLDIKMPVLDGWEFLAAYAKIPGTTAKPAHVVMMSAANDPEDPGKAEENKLVINFQPKPVTTEVLEKLRTHE